MQETSQGGRLDPQSEQPVSLVDFCDRLLPPGGSQDKDANLGKCSPQVVTLFSFREVGESAPTDSKVYSASPRKRECVVSTEATP